uniref:chalcone synthase n=1 Tax=Leersia perrieri TaxID=77586 RepID=A0A0D9XSN5_9ORYZ
MAAAANFPVTGGAAVLAIGTANPASIIPQEEYADWYFRVTGSDHLTGLKAKMKRIFEFSSEKSGIKKRHFHHTEQLLADNPDFIDRTLPSLDARLDITATAVPELAAAAARKAIAEWGRPADDITHLVVATTSGGGKLVGADVRLAALLSLRPTVRRTLLYLHGCHAGSAALRVAVDQAKSTTGARVLVACADVSLIAFRGPHEDGDVDTLVLQALFGDGAAAVIIGDVDPVNPVERPIFHVASAAQATIPATEHVVTGRIRQGGLDYHISRELPSLVGEHIGRCLADAIATAGVDVAAGDGGWNDMFWAVHPGGPAILDSVEKRLGLAAGKLEASRRVLSEFGNMTSATVIFVLDELRRGRGGEEGGECGVAVAFGPGVTVETMVLRRAVR